MQDRSYKCALMRGAHLDSHLPGRHAHHSHLSFKRRLRAYASELLSLPAIILAQRLLSVLKVVLGRWPRISALRTP